MTPIGRGQRQLIIGDRKTGKTAVCVDTIINQKDNWASGDPKKQVRCIYVAIGQKGSTIAGVRSALEDAGAMEYTTIVAAPASDPAGFKWLAPYTGSAIGQHWMYAGQARPDHLRRPVQAGRGLPGDLAAAAPPAGPRGLPGRRLLPALPAAGALREALRRARRGLDDRPADHRDEGQRRVGLHPDERHLDHRRPGASWSPTCSTRACGPPSTSASRCRASVAPRRCGPCARSPARCGWTCRSTASWRRSPRSAPTSTPRRPPLWAAAAAWSSCSSSRSTRRSRSRSR